MTAPTLSRRELLALLGSATAFVVSGCGGDGGDDDAGGSGSGDELSGSVATTAPGSTQSDDAIDRPAPERRPASQLEPLVAIGQGYLIAYPHENDVALLVGAVGEEPPNGGADAAWAADVTGRRRIAVMTDFNSGRVVDVDGWILAETEARIAALVYLAQA